MGLETVISAVLLAFDRSAVQATLAKSGTNLVVGKLKVAITLQRTPVHSVLRMGRGELHFNPLDLLIHAAIRIHLDSYRSIKIAAAFGARD